MVNIVLGATFQEVLAKPQPNFLQRDLDALLYVNFHPTMQGDLADSSPWPPGSRS